MKGTKDYKTKGVNNPLNKNTITLHLLFAKHFTYIIVAIWIEIFPYGR